MNFFTSQKSVTIKRQVYVGNISSLTTLSTDNCYLKPLSETESSNNGFQFGIGYNAIFEVGVDVKENDKLVIDTIEYTVKGVASFEHGNLLDYKRALIVKPQ
jgi:hypothetical protein